MDCGLNFLKLHIWKYFNPDILFKKRGGREKPKQKKKTQTDITYLQKIFCNSYLLFCWFLTALQSPTQLWLHICQKVALGIKTCKYYYGIDPRAYDMLTWFDVGISVGAIQNCKLHQLHLFKAVFSFCLHVKRWEESQVY